MASVWRRDRRRCWLCRRSVAVADASRDHVEPASLGGYDKSANYRLAHRVCNTSRGNLSEVTVNLLRDELDRTSPGWKPVHRQEVMRGAIQERNRRLSRAKGEPDKP